MFAAGFEVAFTLISCADARTEVENGSQVVRESFSASGAFGAFAVVGMLIQTSAGLPLLKTEVKVIIDGCLDGMALLLYVGDAVMVLYAHMSVPDEARRGNMPFQFLH